MSEPDPLWVFVAAVMTVGAPTPQPDTDEDGSRSVVWLVDRREVEAFWLPDGSWTVHVTEPDDTHGPCWDGGSGQPVPEVAVTTIRRILTCMGAGVRVRVRRHGPDPCATAGPS